VFTGSFTSGPAVSRGQVYLGTGDAAFTFLTGQPLGPGSIMALGLPDRGGPPPAPVTTSAVAKARPPAAAPQLSINDVRKNGGNDRTTVFLFTVTLSAPASGAVTVHYVSADRTATHATWSGLFNDYEATAGTLTFAPGETQKAIAVAVYGDRLREGDDGDKVVTVG
jgi:enoyl-CoA hydratase/carnithine racemase